MPGKNPEQWVPSPFLRVKVGPQKVVIPEAITNALYALRQDKEEIEYGGAMDFELLHGKPTVERVLTYTGLVKEIPRATWDKVFRNPDVELTFHTHPRQGVAIPSEGDIVFFLTTAQQVMLIVGGLETLILTKGTGTPPWSWCLENIDDVYKKSKVAVGKGYRPQAARKEQAEMLSELKRLLDVDSALFPKQQPIEVIVKIVQDLAQGAGEVPQFFSM